MGGKKQEDDELERGRARRFWAELHPFYRPILADDLDLDPFPWASWFFARADGGPFMNELRKIARVARREGALEPECDDRGVLLGRQVVVPDAQEEPGQAPESERAQTRLPW